MLVLDHVVSCNNRCLVSSVVSNYLGFFSFLFRHLCCDTGSPSEQNKTILPAKFMPICMLVLDHVVSCNNICLVSSVVSNYLGFFSFFFRHLCCDTGSPSEQNKTSLPAKWDSYKDAFQFLVRAFMLWQQMSSSQGQSKNKQFRSQSLYSYACWFWIMWCRATTDV